VGIPLTFCTDRNLFNLRKLQSQTKTRFAIIHKILFADDCALAAHTLQEAQTLLDHFVAACRCLGLCVSLKKTEALFQLSPDSTYSVQMVTIGNTPVPVANTFCYLGSCIQHTGSLDEEITARLAQANSAFHRLTKQLWDDHGIHIDTKVAVYHAVVLTSLLYSSRAWTLYYQHIKKLDNFHIVLPALHTQCQMAGQSAKHHHTGEVWHLLHRSHPTPKPASMLRSCLPHA